LTADNYHRYHFVDDGTIIDHKKIKGKLHTVSPISEKRYRVYIENQREVTHLATKHLGDVVQIEVGALQIGKITNHSVEQFNKGDEKGYFSFGGSTVILLIRKGRVNIDGDIRQYSQSGIETKVKIGEKVGGIINF
jgi:phosphatidylserine decarboxylase